MVEELANIFPFIALQWVHSLTIYSFEVHSFRLFCLFSLRVVDVINGNSFFITFLPGHRTLYRSVHANNTQLPIDTLQSSLSPIPLFSCPNPERPNISMKLSKAPWKKPYLYSKPFNTNFSNFGSCLELVFCLRNAEHMWRKWNMLKIHAKNASPHLAKLAKLFNSLTLHSLKTQMTLTLILYLIPP